MILGIPIVYFGLLACQLLVLDGSEKLIRLLVSADHILSRAGLSLNLSEFHPLNFPRMITENDLGNNAILRIESGPSGEKRECYLFAMHYI